MVAPPTPNAARKNITAGILFENADAMDPMMIKKIVMPISMPNPAPTMIPCDSRSATSAAVSAAKISGSAAEAAVTNWENPESDEGDGDEGDGNGADAGDGCERRNNGIARPPGISGAQKKQAINH